MPQRPISFMWLFIFLAASRLPSAVCSAVTTTFVCPSTVWYGPLPLVMVYRAAFFFVCLVYIFPASSCASMKLLDRAAMIRLCVSLSCSSSALIACHFAFVFLVLGGLQWRELVRSSGFSSQWSCLCLFLLFFHASILSALCFSLKMAVDANLFLVPALFTHCFWFIFFYIPITFVRLNFPFL